MKELINNNVVVAVSLRKVYFNLFTLDYVCAKLVDKQPHNTAVEYSLYLVLENGEEHEVHTFREDYKNLTEVYTVLSELNKEKGYFVSGYRKEESDIVFELSVHSFDFD